MENLEKKKRKINGKLIFNLSILVIALGLLAFFCFSDDGLVDLVKSSENGFHWGFMALAVGGMLGDLFLDAWLIYLFTRASCKGYPMRAAMKSGMVGHFYSAITPFQSGGQPMQVYLMAQQGVDAGIATSALVQKFLVYQSCLVVYSAVALLFRFSFFSGALGGAVGTLSIIGFLTQAAVIFLILLFSFSRSVTEKVLTWFCSFLFKIRLLRDYESALEGWMTQLDYFHQSNQELFRRKKLLAVTVAVTFAQQTSLFLVPYFVYRAFFLQGASAVDMVFAQGFVTMVSSMVPLPGASVASEGTFYLFFSIFFSQETIKSAILVWRTITYYGVIFLTAPFSGITRRMKKNGAQKAA